MPHRIRQTSFTWDPDQETRGDIWNRIKLHVQRELDRISEKRAERRHHERRRASPTYARNLQILEAALGGTSVPVIARAHGLKPARVREIIRIEIYWNNQARALAPDREPPGNLPTRCTHDILTHSSKSATCMPDP